MFNEMITTAEAFYQKLNIPYQVVNIVSGQQLTIGQKEKNILKWEFLFSLLE